MASHWSCRRLPLLLWMTAVVFSPVFVAAINSYSSDYSTIYTNEVYIVTASREDSVISTRLTVSPGITPSDLDQVTSKTSAMDSYSPIVSVTYYLDGMGGLDTTDAYDYFRRSETSVYTFVQPVLISLPASCSSDFTYTTSSTLAYPSFIASLVSANATSTVSTSSSFYSTKTVKYTLYLTAGALELPRPVSENYYSSFYFASCSVPAFLANGVDRSADGSNYRNPYDFISDDDDCNHFTCRPWFIIVIVFVSLIVGLFLFGFIESFLWFRRMMLGKWALRFGTISWVLISLWVLLLTRRSRARSEVDQAALREKWNALSMGTKLKLWLKWGFRHRYPTELLGTETTTAQEQQQQQQQGWIPSQGAMYAPFGPSPFPPGPQPQRQQQQQQPYTFFATDKGFVAEPSAVSSTASPFVPNAPPTQPMPAYYATTNPDGSLSYIAVDPSQFNQGMQPAPVFGMAPPPPALAGSVSPTNTSTASYLNATTASAAAVPLPAPSPATTTSATPKPTEDTTTAATRDGPSWNEHTTELPSRRLTPPVQELSPHDASTQAKDFPDAK